MTQILIGWPSKSSGLYFNALNYTLLKANSPCAQPEHLLELNGSFQGMSATFTSQDSFIAFAYPNNRIVEYNIGSGHVSK